MRVAFYEDRFAADFTPLTLMRPVFELVCGNHTLRDRVVRTLAVSEWFAFVRPYLAEAYREQHTEARVNDTFALRAEPTLVINGRWLPTTETLRNLSSTPHDVAGVIDGVPVYLWLDPEEHCLVDGHDFDDAVDRLLRTRRRVHAQGSLLRRPWDLIACNDRQIEEDALLLAARKRLDPADIPGLAIVGPSERVHIASTVEIDPYVVFDTRKGSIGIDDGAKIQAFTRVEGPCHIGRGAQLFRAHIRMGTSIGPICRVGGEVEASILHSYVNKYHEGFFGHSYACPWVNLGALSSNSDLKNDYSSVSVPLHGLPIDSGTNKVGCFIGDHTKTALCSLFNTGSSVGVMAMILPGGELLPKFIPSFSTVWHGDLTMTIPFDRTLQAARAAMERRDCALSAAQVRLLRHLYELTRSDREAALQRAAAAEAIALRGS